MLKKFILIDLIAVLHFAVFSQEIKENTGISNPGYIKRSAIGNCGISKVVEYNSNKYYISQSIGQGSVTGTYSKNNYTILQGFQQPLISAKTISVKDKNELKGKLYPNPFRQSVTVLFEDLIKDQLAVTIYNTSVIQVYSNEYAPGQLLNIPLDFLSAGNYILKINCNNKLLVSKIIKQ